MTTTPNSRSLPARPDLDQYKKQAKELLDALQSRNPQALARFQAACGFAVRDAVTLADAQFALAREHGFENWATFKSEIELRQSKKIEPLEAFKDAVQSGDALGLRDLFQKYPQLRDQVNAPIFSFGARPLHVTRPHHDAFDVLLEHGANIHLKSDWSPGPWSLLEDADDATADFLISRGAVVDVFAAAHLGKLDRLKELLDADPNLVHARGGDGRLPLHCAKKPEIMDLLIARGADIEARDVDHGATALQWAVPRPPADGQKNLIEPDLERCRQYASRGAKHDIFSAAAVGDADAIRKVIQADPTSLTAKVGNPYYKPCPHGDAGHIYIYVLGSNKTAHQIAAEFGSDDCLAILMQHSTPVQRFLTLCANADESAARAVLREYPNLMRDLSTADRGLIADCAGRGQLAAVRLMLDLGFPIDARGGAMGGTPLHWASWFGHLPVVEFLIEKNAPINALDTDVKSTPLGWCCHGSKHCARQGADYAGIARALVARGATPAHNAADATDAVRAALKRV